MRLGKLSGKLYSDDDIKNMPECGVCISDAEAEDPDFLKNLHEMVSADCKTCRGCPLYNMEKSNHD